MIKNFNSFIDESLFSSQKKYYNSHGQFSSFHEIRDIEVYDRENYTPEEFQAWQDKYEISDGDQVIWITDNKKQAYAYLLPADYHDEIHNMSIGKIKSALKKEDIDDDIKEIKDKGFIIPESDDGDNGYLFVKRK
jgi:hypothetical protein